MRARHNIRYTPGQGRSHFATQADKDAELAGLADLIQYADRLSLRKTVKMASQRRRKMTGWVVGS